MGYDANNYLYILKESEQIIQKGKEMTKHLILPKGYSVNDNLAYQIGAGLCSVVEAAELAKELTAYKNG